MRKITKMGEVGALEEVFLCDRMTCTNSFTERPHYLVKIGMWNPDLCWDCLMELREWVGDLPWRIWVDVTTDQITTDQLPRAVSSLTALIDLIVRMDGDRMDAENEANSLRAIKEHIDQLAEQQHRAQFEADSAAEEMAPPRPGDKPEQE